MNLISKENKIYIAGSSGMVGGALVRSLKENNYTNIITSKRSFLNLLDFEATDEWIKKIRPDVTTSLPQPKLEEFWQIITIQLIFY